MENKILALKEIQANVNCKLKDTLADSESSTPFGPVPETLRDENDDVKNSTNTEQQHQTAQGTESHSISSLTNSRSFDLPRKSTCPDIGPTQSFGRYDNGSDVNTQREVFRDRGNPTISTEENDNNTWSFWPNLVGSTVGPPPSPARLRRADSREAPATSRDASSIDFASGFSGHRGLNHSAKQNEQGQRNVRMMSHHSGAQ
jgi:hypothetical protein